MRAALLNTTHRTEWVHLGQSGWRCLREPDMALR